MIDDLIPAQPGTEADVLQRRSLRDQARMSMGSEEDAMRAILRELRGELTGIRTRLDSLVAIQQELRYQGQRLTAIEKRLTTLVETKVQPLPVPATTFQSPG